MFYGHKKMWCSEAWEWRSHDLAERNSKCPNRAFCSYRLLNDVCAYYLTFIKIFSINKNTFRLSLEIHPNSNRKVLLIFAKRINFLQKSGLLCGYSAFRMTHERTSRKPILLFLLLGLLLFQLPLRFTQFSPLTAPL